MHWCAAHRCVAVTLCTGSGPPRRHPSPDSYPLESECSPLADHPGARRLLVWPPHGQRDPVLPHIIHAEQLRAAECPAWSSCRLEQLSPGADGACFKLSRQQTSLLPVSGHLHDNMHLDKCHIIASPGVRGSTSAGRGTVAIGLPRWQLGRCPERPPASQRDRRAASIERVTPGAIKQQARDRLSVPVSPSSHRKPLQCGSHM